MKAGSTAAPSRVGAERPWVVISWAQPEHDLVQRIADGLRQGGLLIKGHDAPADGSKLRQAIIASAGAYIAIASTAYVVDNVPLLY